MLPKYFDLHKGSSLTFSAQEGRGKEKKDVAAKISVRPSKGMAEGGCGGNSAIPLQKIEASPAALLVKARHHRKILFSLRERKIGRAQNEKSKEYFSVVWRVVASGGGAASLVPFKVGSRIFKQRAPNWTSQFSGSHSDRMLAAPNGAASKELGGEIKRRDEIPRNNFFGNEVVHHNKVMYKNKFLFQFFAQNTQPFPGKGWVEAIFHSLAEHY